jgi:hypothetical protein
MRPAAGVLQPSAPLQEVRAVGVRLWEGLVGDCVLWGRIVANSVTLLQREIAYVAFAVKASSHLPEF